MTKSIWGAMCAIGMGLWGTAAEASPCLGNVTTTGSVTATDAPLTLNGVLAEIRRTSPAVRTAGLEIRARKAETRQAGRSENPSLSIEVENFAGSGTFSGHDVTETTYALEQTLRLGGKRRYEERAAKARQALASAECAVILRQSQFEGAALFFELASATELAALAAQSSELATSLSEIVEARVSAGAAAPPELARARAEAATTMALTTQAAADVMRRQFDLAGLWGASEWPFGSDIADDRPWADQQPDGETLSRHPVLQQAEAAEQVSREQYSYERSLIVPNITVSAGYRRFEETDDSAFIAGFTVALPLFDRNRDAVEASQLRTKARKIDTETTAGRLQAELQYTVVELNAAKERQRILTEISVPAAITAYDASVRGYRVGKFDLTSTIDARRTLIETRRAAIEATLALNIAEAKLRSLTGAAPFKGPSDAP